MKCSYLNNTENINKVVVFQSNRFLKCSTHNVAGLGSLKENAGRLLQSANFRQLDAVNFGTSHQGDINCSSLPAGLGGNGEFERKSFKMKSAWEEAPQLKSPWVTSTKI